MSHNVIYLYQGGDLMKNNIKVIRVARGLTQDQLAEQLGVRRETIIRIEKGQNDCTLSTAYSISQILKCSLDDLVKDDIISIK